MKSWVNLFRVIILIVGIAVLAFNIQLYILCKKQGVELNAMKDKQDVESEFNSNKFKYQEEKIYYLSHDLHEAQKRIKEQNDSIYQQKDEISAQKDALLQEAGKRQQIENTTNSIQTSLVDIKAETDAIKLDMKGWQKDYVAVLAQLEKKMDDSQNETKSLEDNLTALDIPGLKDNINSLKVEIEKVTHPPDNGLSNMSSTLQKNTEVVELKPEKQ